MHIIMLIATILSKAFQYLKRSGQKAMRKNSTWEALDYYEKAIAVLERLPENNDQKRKKLEVTYLTISPLIALGFPDKSLSILEQGERLAKDLADERRLFRFRTNIGFLYCSATAIILRPGPISSRRLTAAEKLHDVRSDGTGNTGSLYGLSCGWRPYEKRRCYVRCYRPDREKRKATGFFRRTHQYLFQLCTHFVASVWDGPGILKKHSHSVRKVILRRPPLTMPGHLACVIGCWGPSYCSKESWSPQKYISNAAIKYNEKLKHTPTLPLSYSWLGLASGPWPEIRQPAAGMPRKG